MYVRWKRRTLRRETMWRHPGGTALTAVLVRSEWNNGKPRQRFVAYLGTIPERYVGQPYSHILFWRAVNPRLDALGLDDATRASVQAMIERRITIPDAQTEAVEMADAERIKKQFSELSASGPHRQRRKT